MKSEDLTKLARWIVPGWISILAFCGFVVIDIVFTLPNHPQIFADLTEFINSLSGIDAVLGTILIAASGIPLGFFIYQLYFFMRWNSPFSRDGLVALIPGRFRDLDAATLELDERDLSLKQKWRANIIAHPLFEIDHGFKWRYIEPLFLQACQELDTLFSGLSIYSRHRYLHEVVHTLGASIGAVYMGFVAYLALRFAKESLSVWYLVGVFILSAGFFVLLHAEAKWRQSLLLDREFATIDKKNFPMLHLSFGKVGFAFPSAQLIATLAIIDFLANPRLIPSESVASDIPAKMLLTVLVLAAWGGSQRSLAKQFKLGNGVWAILSIMIGLFLRFFPRIGGWIDWPFLTAVFGFLTANLVLFLNRRNANEDMLAIENYTLKRYVTREKPFYQV